SCMIKEYEQELIDNKRNDTTISFLAASPQTNQFYASRYVSAGYTENERGFVERTKGEQTDFGSRNQLEITRNHLKSLEIL
ncbi:unnamed protein product, partial [Rotaria magnacalcarata]